MRPFANQGLQADNSNAHTTFRVQHKSQLCGVAVNSKFQNNIRIGARILVKVNFILIHGPEKDLATHTPAMGVCVRESVFLLLSLTPLFCKKKANNPFA